LDRLLQDIITSKRHRTWHKVLEQIMTRYIDLCVELKKGREAKDGLIHYRNVCQHVNVSSLEEVIKYFLKTATDKAEEAQSKADLVAPSSLPVLHLHQHLPIPEVRGCFYHGTGGQGGRYFAVNLPAPGRGVMEHDLRMRAALKFPT
jgi:hypothetical protein